jgi:preprotein translocase subunit SecA
MDTFASKELQPHAWDLPGLRESVQRDFGVAIDPQALEGDREQAAERVDEALGLAYDARVAALGEEMMGQLERTILLSVIDAKWKDHLYMMDALREGIHLRAYGQRDPLVEYQREAYRMFQEMIQSVKVESLSLLMRVQPAGRPEPVSVFARTPQQELHPDAPGIGQAPPVDAGPGGPGEAAPASMAPELFNPSALGRVSASPAGAPSAVPKVGRNDPCPCGSGQKYKKCHGK